MKDKKMLANMEKSREINIYTGVFFILLEIFLLFGFATFGDYGISWDEPIQQLAGRTALNHLAHGVDKASSLPNDLIYYGPFFEMANRGFGNFLVNSFQVDYVSAFHVLILLFSALGLFFFYQLVALMFDKRTALFSSTFLMLYPVFLAHSQYNSKDIPMLGGCAATLFFLYSGFSLKKKSHVFLAGIAFGLTLAIRVDAFLIVPVFFFPYFINLFFKSRKKENFAVHLKKAAASLIIFAATSALVIFAAWPSLWSRPLLFFEAITYFAHHSWPGKVLYFGSYYPGSGLPWHYPLFYLSAAVPVLVLFFSLIGLGIIFINFRKSGKDFEYTLVLYWFFLRLAISFPSNSVKYDGIRHFLFIVPPLMIMAGMGLDFFRKKISKIFPLQKTKIIIVIFPAIFLWLLIENVRIFPFGGAYYNEAARLAFPRSIEKKFDFEYWGSPYRQGVNWLNDHAEMNSSYCAPIASHLISYYPVRADLSFNCYSNPKYLMFFTRYAFLPKNLDLFFHYSSLKPVYKISRYNSDILYIYKLK